MKAALRSAVAAFALVAVDIFGASVIQFSATSYPVTEGAGPVSIAIQRTSDLDTVVGVEFVTTNLSATAGLDYLDVVTNVTFGAGETNRVIAVPMLNDALVEGLETFRASLSNPSGGAMLGPRTVATARITDNDKGLQLELASYSVNEDAGTATVRVLRRDDGEFPVTVDYATTSLTAVPGSDYLDASGTLAFAPGETVKYVNVALVNDVVPEPSKSFRITLSNPTGGSVLGTPVIAAVTLTDTDDLVQFQTASATNLEDCPFVRVAVIRGESASASGVDVTTLNGTALAGLDYAGVTNTLSFVPGERLKTLEVPILNDDIKEANETFRLTLGNPSGGAALGPTRTMTVTLLDNDPGVGFERSTNAVWERTPALSLNVVRGNDGRLGPFTMEYQTADGTAVGGLDYQPASGTLDFATNEMVKAIPLLLLQDPAPEAAKYFWVTLTNVTGEVALGRSTCRVTIVDDSQGSVEWAQPDVRGEIGIEAGVAEVTWTGSAVLSRADSVTGPWEQLGTGTSPQSVPANLPGAFYRLRSPRAARLYVPSSYDGQTPLPLVLVLHGYSGDAASYVDYFRIEPLAEKRGFLVCHPEGTFDRQGYRFWNATEACCNFYGATVDDSAYLRGLVEEIGRWYAVDRKRISVTGHSNGGYMSYRMACDHADLIASIASLAGMTFLDPNTPRPAQPVHVLQIHGTADEVVPYGGGALIGLPTTGLFPGAIATVQAWADFNGCQGPVWDAEATMDLDLAVTGLDTTAMRYTNCPPGGAVELWTIQGGTHGPTLVSGTMNSEYSARVVDWLLTHPKP